MAAITTNEEGEFTAQLKGEFHWDLIIDIDNTINGSASIKREMKVVSEVALNYDALVRSLKSTPAASFGTNGGGTLEVLSVGVNGDLHPEVKAAYENLPKTQTASVKKTTKEAVTYEVGPTSSFKLYRLVFKAPGVTYMTDNLSTSTDPIPHVPIEVKGRLLPAVRGMAALYGGTSAGELKGSPINKVAKLAKDEGHFKADLKGEFYWELFMEIDNSKYSGSIKREWVVGSVISISHNNMVRSLKSSIEDTSMGLEVGGSLIDVVSIGVKGSLTTEVKSEYENMTDTKEDKTISSSKTDTIEVAAHGVVKYYRLIFKAPGVAHMTDTISSTRHAIPEVPIEIEGRRIPVLKEIEVVYTSDSITRPDDIIVGARGEDPNLLAGWNSIVKEGHPKGPHRYVWLRPIWTMDASEGITGIQIACQPKPNESYKDLRKGVGGPYIYLKMLRDPHSKHRITEIVLWQETREEQESKKGGPPSKDYKFSVGGVPDPTLHLAWNTRELE